MSADATVIAADAISAVGTAEGWEDPYSHYARLREAARVYEAWRNVYVVSRYDDCMAVAKSPDFMNRDDRWYDEHKPGWRVNPSMVFLYRSLLYANPPVHTRLRRLVGGAFTPRRVESLRPAVERLCAERLDDLELADTGGGADFQSLVGSALPFIVIGLLVGVPASDWQGLERSVRDYGLLIEPRLTPEELDRANAAVKHLREYFGDLIAERRRSPRDDLVSALVTIEESDGEQLTEDELLDTISMLFSAGSDTTTSLLGNGALALIQHPDQLRLLREDPTLAARAVEELLRFDPPIHFSSRYAEREVVIAGTTIPAGATVLMMLGAANRDPDRFPDPDRLDITRTEPHMLSFGGGIHYCLGAPLARLEGAVVFGQLARRFPRLRLAGRPVLRRGPNMRGRVSLPVALA